MLKRKHSYEKAVNIILNDEYKENLIVMHYDDLEDTAPESMTSSRVIVRPRVKNPRNPQEPNYGATSSMKRVQKKQNIFDEESIDLGRLPPAQPQPAQVRVPGKSRRSLKDINQEMAFKETQRQAQRKGGWAGDARPGPGKGVEELHEDVQEGALPHEDPGGAVREVHHAEVRA